MTGGNRRVMDEAVLGFDVFRCATCGAALDGDPDEDPTGDGGMPICGECERSRDFSRWTSPTARSTTTWTAIRTENIDRRAVWYVRAVVPLSATSRGRKLTGRARDPARPSANTSTPEPMTHGEAAERLVVDRLARGARPRGRGPARRALAAARTAATSARARRTSSSAIPSAGILAHRGQGGRDPTRPDRPLVGGPTACPRVRSSRPRDSRHALVRKLRELPDWPAGLSPIAGQAVAFPDVELRLDARTARPAGPGRRAST